MSFALSSATFSSRRRARDAPPRATRSRRMSPPPPRPRRPRARPRSPPPPPRVSRVAREVRLPSSSSSLAGAGCCGAAGAAGSRAAWRVAIERGCRPHPRHTLRRAPPRVRARWRPARLAAAAAAAARLLPARRPARVHLLGRRHAARLRTAAGAPPSAPPSSPRPASAPPRRASAGCARRARRAAGHPRVELRLEVARARCAASAPSRIAAQPFEAVLSAVGVRISPGGRCGRAPPQPRDAVRLEVRRVAASSEMSRCRRRVVRPPGPSATG